MIATKPKYLVPQGKLFSVFNVSNFYSNNEFVTESRLMEYGNLYSKNIFYYINSFLNGLTFEVSINGIAKEVFALVAYLPNVICEISNVSFDEENYSTNITGGTWFENSSIGYNLNVGYNLNTTNILTQKLTTDVIQVNNLTCKNLSINGQKYNEVIGFIYLNGVSLPLQKSNILSNFNINSISSIYFSLQQGYRLDCVDINNSILFSYTNISSDFIYYQQIVYNINMFKVNIYNSMNNLL
jgi:hypothetical protein